MTLAETAAAIASKGHAVFPVVLAGHPPIPRGACLDCIASQGAHPDGAEPLTDPATGHRCRNAIDLPQGGWHVTFG